MKEAFCSVYNARIKREGADKLLEWLDKTDFYRAPASSKYHLCREGGLVEHSLHVYWRLRDIFISELRRTNGAETELTEEQEETIAICGLLHDLCKVNFYDVEMRNRKNEQGVWEKYPVYIINDKLPFGHGEKSQYIVGSYMKLKRDESMAIRFHMGFSDDTFKAGAPYVGKAFGMFPLAVMLHMADLMATYMDEKE